VLNRERHTVVAGGMQEMGPFGSNWENAIKM